ncbi:hypothetical protein [Kitasatospora sp. NPDC059571]|uniref:hypothetical protein n=1 Tax=Kitasatospora sp. NPDC059571 TaxID=3346871 RepID=UPI0036C67B22
MIVEATVGVNPEWASGPLPVHLMWAGDQAIALSLQAADQATRLTYFEERVSGALYGRDGRPVRWHRPVSATLRGSAVLAVEVLRNLAVPGTGLAVVHVALGPDPAAELAAWTDLSTSDRGVKNREFVNGLLPEGIRIAEYTRRTWTLAHVTFETTPLAPVMPGPYREWGPRDQWLWLMASATPLNCFPPDPEDHDALFRGRIRFSADWQVLVLRDGAAFLGVSPDLGTDSFHAAAATHVHSIYLDVFLLGMLHGAALNRLANEISALHTTRLTPSALVAIESRLINTRTMLGMEHVTVHGKGNELLAAYQLQHRHSELRRRLVEDLTDSARFVDAQTNRSVNAALGLVTALGLPFALSYSAAAVAGAGSTNSLLWATLIAFALAAGLTLLPPVRAMLGALRGWRRHSGDDLEDKG